MANSKNTVTPLFTCFLALFLCFQLSASTLSDDHFLIETWTTEKGLSHNTIADITQSNDKYIWLTSWEGVDRFDGHSFKNIKEIHNVPVTDNAARGFATAPNGNIYIGGTKGQVLIRSEHGQWQEFVRFNSQVNLLTFHHLYHLLVVTEEQKLFAVSASGERTELIRSLVMADDRITSLTLVNDQIVLGTTSGLYYIRDQKLVQLVDLGPVRVNQVFFTNNKLYVATSRGVVVLSGSDFSKQERWFEHLDVLALTIDSNDRLWFGTAKSGLYLRDEKGALTNFGTDDNLANNRVTKIFEDHEQSIWAGTVGGLSRIRESQFRAVSTRQGLQSNYIRAVMEGPAGDIWIGSSDGLARYNKKTNEVISRHLDGQSILSIALSPHNEILVGTYTDGVFIKSGEGFKPYITTQNGLPSNQVRSISTNSKGEVWIGTAQGLLRLKDDVQTAFSSGMSSNVVAVVKEIDGQMWAGTSRGIDFIVDEKFIEIKALESLQSGHVFDFYQDEQLNVVWIATDTGLYRYDLETSELARLSHLDYQNVAKFFTVIRDNNNYLWLSSNQGVFRLSINSVNRLMNGESVSLEYDVFEESEGLLSKQANGRSTPAGYLDSDGVVWFATSKGAVSADTKQLETYEGTTNPLRIESIEIDKVFQDVTNKITLQAYNQHLRVNFTSINLKAPNRTEYRARLVGFDEEWENRGAVNSVEYTSLEPGTYTLEISTSIAPYDWSRPVKLNITKLPYWWETSVFKLSALITIMLIIGIVFYYKAMLDGRRNALLEEKIKEKTSKLQKRSQELSAANKEKSELLEKLIENTRILEQLSQEDDLTKLLNRRAFSLECAKWDAYSRRKGSEYCIAFLDIDNFKQVNDEWSHSVGDEVLKAVAKVIESNVRDIDIVARWGGEEFIVLFPDTELSSAHVCTQRIRMAVEQHKDPNWNDSLSLTLSGGLASSIAADSYEQTIHFADMALYRAKEAGRNCICTDEQSSPNLELKQVT